MAEPSLETPVETPPAIPEKEWWKSTSIWVSLVAIVAGLLSSNGGLTELASYIQTNKDEMVAWVLQGIGYVGVFAALRRKTALKIGK